MNHQAPIKMIPKAPFPKLREVSNSGSRSGLVQIVLERDPENDGAWALISVQGDVTRTAEHFFSNVEWANEEWSNLGTDMFPAELMEDESISKLLITGYMWSDRIDSIDFGTDWDGGFEVTDERILR